MTNDPYSTRSLAERVDLAGVASWTARQLAAIRHNRLRPDREAGLERRQRTGAAK